MREMITYHRWQNNWFFKWLYKTFFCKHGIHLIDEVHSTDGEKYLWCDACDLSVEIADF